MDIKIKSDVVIKHKLSIYEAALLWSLYGKTHPVQMLQKLHKANFISGNPTVLGSVHLTQQGVTEIEQIISESEICNEWKESDIKELADALRETYPKGKKPGTSYYWSEGPVLLCRRLTVFFKKYGTEFTKEQIIEATKKYVNDWYGKDTARMRLLKYFIFKEADGGNEPTSDLYNYLVHIQNQEETQAVLDENWLDNEL